MNFPFFSSKKLSSKYYLAILLKEENGIVLALNYNGKKIFILEREYFHYSNGWENIIEDIDEVLFRLEKKLNISLDEVIFFVYSHFIDEKTIDIKKPYLQKIKKIVKNLELNALGYIDCSEAIIKYLEKKEEMPLTAILVELDVTNVSVFIYKGGRIAYRKVLSRTDNLVEDLLVAFEELKGKFLLPSRIILYNSKDLDEESTKIISYHWDKDFFIQLPRVEILKEEETLNSLIDIFSEQIIKREKNNPIQSQEEEGEFGFIIGKDIETDEQKFKNEEKKPIKIPHFKLKVPVIKLNVSKKISVIFGVALITLILFLNELLFHKAKITVFLSSEVLNKKVIIDTVIGEKNNSLPIFISTSSASFNVSKKTTGTADIGDLAKGTVSISNFSDEEKLFPKGTIMDTGGIKFSLNNDVKVASASLTTDGSAKLPGKNTGEVTALDIGPEGNINSGQRLTIDNLPQSVFFAVSSNSFSGGSRKKVKTVSKQDIQFLEEEILKKAGKTNINLTDNLKNNKEIITQLTKTELKDKKYSKEVGEEADSVSLQSTAVISTYYFNKSDLFDYVSSQLSFEVKKGFALEKNNIDYIIDSAKQQNNDINLSISITAKTIKKISKDEILKKVIGKNKSTLENLLKKEFQADGYELLIKNPLPFFDSFLPIIKNNITVVISAL